MRVIIALDDYEDIFDDFDIRPYEKRGISTDFLEELVRRLDEIKAQSKKERLEIVLTLPKRRRIKRDEKRIKQRLKEFFDKRRRYFENKKRETLVRGLGFIALGISSLLAAVYSYENISELLGDYLFVGVYFFTWNGLDIFLYRYWRIKRISSFYDKLATADIYFENEEVYEV